MLQTEDWARGLRARQCMGAFASPVPDCRGRTVGVLTPGPSNLAACLRVAKPGEAEIPAEEARPTAPRPLAGAAGCETVDLQRPGCTRPSEGEFERVVRENQARILRVALGMLRDRYAAEDVAQETFVRAYRFYETFRSDSALFTWLYRIAVNLCLDVQRKSRVRATVPLEAIDEIHESRDPSPTPERVLETRELAKHVEAGLEMLTPNHCVILLLREVEGLSYEEISRVLRIPKGTVMSRLHHARMNLQRACQALAG